MEGVLSTIGIRTKDSFHGAFGVALFFYAEKEGTSGVTLRLTSPQVRDCRLYTAVESFYEYRMSWDSGARKRWSGRSVCSGLREQNASEVMFREREILSSSLMLGGAQIFFRQTPCPGIVSEKN